jgi:hypothetical protein
LFAKEAVDMLLNMFSQPAQVLVALVALAASATGCGSDDIAKDTVADIIKTNDSLAADALSAHKDAGNTNDTGYIETLDGAQSSSGADSNANGDTITDAGPPPNPCEGKADGDACADGNPCTVGDICGKGVCKKGKKLLDCDDGDPCTKDGCHNELACWHEKGPKACDDANPCTNDGCSLKTGCTNEAAQKGDGCAVNACMIGQKCSASLLCLGGKEKFCDDENACTTDSCHDDVGCIFKINNNACADGHACTTDDACNGGTCIGKKTNICPICNNQFGAYAGQLNKVLLGTDGKPPNGLDIDHDAKTCAPANNCNKGVDNSLAALSFAVNKPLNNAMKAGTMRFLFELSGYQGEGKPFSFRLYYGNLQAGTKTCNWFTTPCQWLVTQQSMGPDCKPLASFDNAVIKNGKLTAGGPGQIFALEANLVGSVKPTFYIKGATIEADIELDKTAGFNKLKIKSIDGVIAGAMTEVAVLEVVNALPEANFKPLDKKSALKLVKQLLVLDIDVDGDGINDAASLGIRISGLGAKLLGMSL